VKALVEAVLRLLSRVDMGRLAPLIIEGAKDQDNGFRYTRNLELFFFLLLLLLQYQHWLWDYQGESWAWLLPLLISPGLVTKAQSSAIQTHGIKRMRYELSKLGAENAVPPVRMSYT